MINKNKTLIFFGMIFILISIMSVSAEFVYQIQYDGNNIDYGVITKSFDLIIVNADQDSLSESSGDTLTLLSRSNGVDTYNWTIGDASGSRTFTLGNETQSIPVKSKVEELLDKVDPITVYAYQEYSIIDVDNLDISGATSEYFTFNRNEFTGTFSIQNILNGIGYNVTFEENGAYPTYYSLSLSGVASTIVNNVIDYNSASLTYSNVDNILNNYTLVNELIDIYGLTGDYSFDINAYKSGDDYLFTLQKGYGNYNDTTLDNIRNLISDGVSLVNPTKLNSYVTPYFDFSDYLDNITWTTQIDLSSFSLTDGTYSIPVTLTDQQGNDVIENINLVLDIESNEEQVVVNNTFTPTNDEVLEHIQEITGLPEGDTLTLEVYGETLPPTFVATAPPEDVEDAINYIEINISSNTVGDYKINFTTSNSFNHTLIKAYVYENNGWTQLPTTYLRTASGKHYFYFEVTHFSQFLIAENEADTIVDPPGNGDGNDCNTYWKCGSWSSCVNGEQTRTCEKERFECNVNGDMPEERRTCGSARADEGGTPGLINAEENPGQGKKKGVFSILTGAVIGVFGPTGAIYAIILFVLILVLAFIIIKIKKGRKKEAKAKAEEEAKKKEEKEKKKKAASKKKKGSTKKAVKKKSQKKKVDKRKRARSKRKAKKKVVKKKPKKKTTGKKAKPKTKKK